MENLQYTPGLSAYQLASKIVNTQTTLVAGTKALTIAGVTTSSHAYVQLVTPGTTTLTVQYQVVCTANTVTIQANIAAGTINVADISVLNVLVFKQ